MVRPSVRNGMLRPLKKGGGMSKKGLKALGLRAPTKSGPRHRSFCARSRKWKSARGLAARKNWGC